jgi:hypothetical protein
MKKGCLPLVYGHIAAVSKWQEALIEDEFCVWLYWAAASNPAVEFVLLERCQE